MVLNSDIFDIFNSQFQFKSLILFKLQCSHTKTQKYKQKAEFLIHLKVFYYQKSKCTFHINKFGVQIYLYEKYTFKYLGRKTNEINEKVGKYKIEFVNADHKNYCYKLDGGKTKKLVTCFSLNYTIKKNKF